MGKIEKSFGSVSSISSSDGPTTVFIGGNRKRTLKQRIQKVLFCFRKKWHALWIKPGAHTMDEVIAYVEEKYGLVELPKDDWEYQRQYSEMRASYIMQYEPELLGEYATLPELRSKDEEGIREFQHQFEIRRQKAMEIPEEKFPFDFHILKKMENRNTGDKMEIYLEGRFGYIGGGWSGSAKSGRRSYKKMYKDIWLYYGVSEEDIVNKTKRYEELLRRKF